MLFLHSCYLLTKTLHHLRHWFHPERLHTFLVTPGQLGLVAQALRPHPVAYLLPNVAHTLYTHLLPDVLFVPPTDKCWWRVALASRPVCAAVSWHCLAIPPVHALPASLLLV